MQSVSFQPHVKIIFMGKLVPRIGFLGDLSVSGQSKEKLALSMHIRIFIVSYEFSLKDYQINIYFYAMAKDRMLAILQAMPE